MQAQPVHLCRPRRGRLSRLSRRLVLADRPRIRHRRLQRRVEGANVCTSTVSRLPRLEAAGGVLDHPLVPGGATSVREVQPQPLRLLRRRLPCCCRHRRARFRRLPDRARVRHRRLHRRAEEAERDPPSVHLALRLEAAGWVLAHVVVAGHVAAREVQPQPLRLRRHRRRRMSRRLVLADRSRIDHRSLHRRAKVADRDQASVHPVLRVEAARGILVHALVAVAVAAGQMQTQALRDRHWRLRCRRSFI